MRLATLALAAALLTSCATPITSITQAQITTAIQATCGLVVDAATAAQLVSALLANPLVGGIATLAKEVCGAVAPVTPAKMAMRRQGLNTVWGTYRGIAIKGHFTR